MNTKQQKLAQNLTDIIRTAATMLQDELNRGYLSPEQHDENQGMRLQAIQHLLRKVEECL